MIRYMCLAFLLTLEGCGIAEPEPVSSNMTPPFTTPSIFIRGLVPDQVVSGNLTVAVDSLPPGITVARVDVFIDGRGISSSSTLLWTIDTHYLSNGAHWLKFVLSVVKSPSLGLLNLVFDLRLTSDIPFVVNNSQNVIPERRQATPSVLWNDGESSKRGPQ